MSLSMSLNSSAFLAFHEKSVDFVKMEKYVKLTILSGHFWIMRIPMQK